MTSFDHVSSSLLSQSGSGRPSSTVDVLSLVNGDSVGLGESEAPPAADLPARKRLTAKSTGKLAELPKAVNKNPVEKIGTKEQVVVVGKRIRCKMCRCVP